MLRISLRVSSVLFVITGLITMLSGWNIAHDSLRALLPGSDGYAFFVDFTVASGVCGCIGLALLSGQARPLRHWLGWIGIALTLLGLATSTLSTFTIFSQGYFSSTGNLLLLGAALATPTFALGLIFWALDLPNTSTSLLVQKAVMSMLGILPFFEVEIFRYGAVVTDGLRLLFIETLLTGGLWLALGISVWFYHDPTPVLPSASPASFADSSFDLVVTPLPPTEH